MRIEINDDATNCLLSTMFTAHIQKMLAIHNFANKNKNL